MIASLSQPVDLDSIHTLSSSDDAPITTSPRRQRAFKRESTGRRPSIVVKSEPAPYPTPALLMESESHDEDTGRTSRNPPASGKDEVDEDEGPDSRQVVECRVDNGVLVLRVAVTRYIHEPDGAGGYTLVTRSEIEDERHPIDWDMYELLGEDASGDPYWTMEVNRRYLDGRIDSPTGVWYPRTPGDEGSDDEPLDSCAAKPHPPLTRQYDLLTQCQYVS